MPSFRATTARPRPAPAVRAEMRLRRMFELLRGPETDRVPWANLPDALERAGLSPDDPRLSETYARLHARLRRDPDAELAFAELRPVLAPAAGLIERALLKRLAVPDFAAFCADVRERFRGTAGPGATEPFGLALCTVDGQRFAAGRSAHELSVKELGDVVLYARALEARGADGVHRGLGVACHGDAFGLDARGRATHPLQPAGALHCCGLLAEDATPAARFEGVQALWARLAGRKPGFSHSGYLWSRRSEQRQLALAYLMQSHGAFPAGADARDLSDFAFQCASVRTTVTGLAQAAATFAAGGRAPRGGERVFGPETARRCLAMLATCGMGEHSNRWTHEVGLPARASGGAILAVVPGVLGIAVWSPRLDASGVSARGRAFLREFAEHHGFRAYEVPK